MHVNIVVRMTAQSRGELIDTFAHSVAQYREHIENLKTNGNFGPSENVTIHYLLTGGKWHEEKPEWGLPESEAEAPGPQNVE